jgi:hypothetical protein
MFALDPDRRAMRRAKMREYYAKNRKEIAKNYDYKRLMLREEARAQWTKDGRARPLVEYYQKMGCE